MSRILFAKLLAAVLLFTFAGQSSGQEHPAINQPDKFAWDLFVEINKPAQENNANGPVIWETWALARDVFANPNTPPTWSGRATSRSTRQLERQPLQQMIRQMQKAGLERALPSSPKPSRLRVDPGVIQRHGNETRMNQASFDFIVNNDLYYVEGQEAFFNQGKKVDFPIEAREIKAQWRRLDDPAMYGKYHTATVTNNGATETWGLTALHITTKDLPNWFWATFEHKDNEGIEGVVASHDSFGLDTNGDISNQLQQLFQDNKLGMKWQNYRLRGTQVDFVDSIGRPTILANSQIERGFQATSSCITCHARASIGPKPDQSFRTDEPQNPNDNNRLSVFESGDPLLGSIGSPDPSWFIDTTTVPPARKFTQLDFVWSLFRARRRNPFPGATGTPIPAGASGGNSNASTNSQPSTQSQTTQSPTAPTAANPDKNRLGPSYVLIRAANYDADTRVGLQTAQRLRAIPADNANQANIEVTFNGFSDEAKAAFQGAIDVWEGLLQSPVTIRVQANWTPLGTNVLGSASPNSFRRSFNNAPNPNAWYPIALANKLAGTDLEPGSPDIVCNFNSNFSNWYFGTDGATPAGKFDLMSVVLHELGHGLGYSGSMTVNQNNQGTWGLGTSIPFAYDTFVENGSDQRLTNTSLFPNPSVQLRQQLTGDNLRFDGPFATAANGGTPPPIYAPNPFDPGSSFSHFDEDSFPPGNPNSLMTPQIGRAESIHSPGPLGIALLRDLGWTFSNLDSSLITSNCCGAERSTARAGMRSVVQGPIQQTQERGRFVDLDLSSDQQEALLKNLVNYAGAISNPDSAVFYTELEDAIVKLKASKGKPRTLSSPRTIRRGPARILRGSSRPDLPKLNLRDDKTWQQNFQKWLASNRKNKLRIFGGAPVPSGEKMHCVAVGQNNQFCCTGTLIAPRVVVTAAHCFDLGCIGSTGQVYFGLNSNTPSTGTVVGCTCIPHPNYNAVTNENDIAILILDSPVPFEPCPIATSAQIDQASSLNLAGFGFTERGTFGIKMEVDVIVSSINCGSTADQNLYGCIANKEMVAGGLGFDSCNGDSGGPAYVLEGDRHFLAGATSRAAANSTVACGDGGVYVRVDKYLAWIQATATAQGVSVPGNMNDTDGTNDKPRK